MRARNRAGAIAAVAALLAVAGGSSTALAAGAHRALFVQTDGATGNQIVAYSRDVEGKLTQAGVYDTGGLGGQLAGSVVDHLASQGSLAYDRQNNLLYAVNAGSNTVSVFAVFGDRLALRQVIASGGVFPASITVHGDSVYVLNSEEGGAIQGFQVIGGRLQVIPGSQRALGLNQAETPRFTHTPGQVAFSPDGSKLIVTTKAAGNDVDVFKVLPSGLSSSPVINSVPGVPFGVAFDRQGHLVVSEAAGALASFQLNSDGTIDQLDLVSSGQAATCWVLGVGNHFYASNTGSSTIGDFQSNVRGQLLTLLGNTGTDAAPVDAAASTGGRYLYVQTGAAGIVDEFSIEADGSLVGIGSVSVPGAAGGEGIVTAG